ncbi:MAG: hypothetical protein ABI456_08100 [Ktedonobacteraceae bacterium]|nr:hypothetical protein [Chloroflexota bacterium]
MQIKTDSIQLERKLPPVQRRSPLPLSILSAMVAAFVILDAILPLRGLWLSDALLTRLGTWVLWPTFALFPGWQVSPSLIPDHLNTAGAPSALLSRLESPLLLAAFLLVFVFYLIGLRCLPKHITRRYILGSTLLLGGLCLLVPVASSPDVFSYIAYARMGVLYHLNPLTTVPSMLRHDAVYQYLYWIDQPSAYGPIWVGISSLLQWVALIFGPANLLAPLLAFRLLGLATHLGSTALIWSIGGSLQRAKGYISPELRLRSTLAFAWNPLLLVEACVNAHNDSSLLFLILLAIWFLVRGRTMQHSYLFAALVLALATCLKPNAALLFPGLLLFLWTQPQRVKHSALTIAVYCGTILLLYAPFWQGGAILNVLHINPSTYRNINTLAEFAGQFYNAIASNLGFPLAASIGSRAERFTHTLSTGIFVIIYGWLCWRAFRNPERINTPARLLRWLAVVWLLYCAIGSPWFWPWYLVTFFGLYALIEATGEHTRLLPGIFGQPAAIRLLAFSMLAIYCFFTWGIHASFVPGLPGFQWTYLRGPWAWLLPLFVCGCIRPISAYGTRLLASISARQGAR